MSKIETPIIEGATEISATIKAHSKNNQGDEIISYVLTFPRMILAELNTHRVFSKNSASSRAIPFEKNIESVLDNPFVPIAWQKSHKGMQGTEYWDVSKTYNIHEFLKATNEVLADKTGVGVNRVNAMFPKLLDKYRGVEQSLQDWWLLARDLIVEAACMLHALGISKQICNRVLEPFMWHTVILTATEFDNFFEQRCPIFNTPDVGTFNNHRKYSYAKNINISKDSWYLDNLGQADIHMMKLAEAMYNAKKDSKPKYLKPGEWHIVFYDEIIEGLKALRKPYSTMDIVKIATAWAARVSYTTVGGGRKLNVAKDIKLHDELIEKFHWSPTEHCAKTMGNREYNANIKGYMDTNGDTSKEAKGWSRNFKGFKQYRTFVDL